VRVWVWLLSFDDFWYSGAALLSLCPLDEMVVSRWLMLSGKLLRVGGHFFVHV
jgi:hypothetical protein